MQLEESLSNDTRENTNESPAYAFTEVATLNSDEFRFQPQDQFGRAYNRDDILVFHVTVTEPENMAYLIDLYTYKRIDGPPHHLAYHYLLPTFLKKSEGLLELPITCASKHRPLGMMRLEFVKITPLDDPKCDMKVSATGIQKSILRSLNLIISDFLHSPLEREVSRVGCWSPRCRNFI